MSFAPAQHKKKDRFSSFGGIGHDIERKIAPPAPVKAADADVPVARGKSPARPARSSPAPRARPAPVQTEQKQQPDVPPSATGSGLDVTTPKPRAASAPRQRPVGAALKSPKGALASPKAGGSPESSNPLGGGGPSSAGREKPSSAFAPTSKGRFDSGPGSMYSSAAKATPAPTFNPNDYDSFGGKNASKPSPGFAPTSKGRFDAGPGSMYATATPQPKKTKPKPVDPLDEKAAEWSKALGLGAVAGAKAAPVLKGLDEMRAKAEAEAAEALAAKEAAETSAAEAMRKAEWITKRAEQRVAEAETKLAAAEEALAHSREEHEMTREQLDELREMLDAKDAEIDELRKELKHLPKKHSPKANKTLQAVDRRPVRLRGQLDQEAESKSAALEARKAKREEHWKKVEEERLAKEERILKEQESLRLAKAPHSVRGGRESARTSGDHSERRSSRGPADATEALKAMALLGGKKPAAPKGPPAATEEQTEQTVPLSTRDALKPKAKPKAAALDAEVASPERSSLDVMLVDVMLGEPTSDKPSVADEEPERATPQAMQLLLGATDAIAAPAAFDAKAYAQQATAADAKGANKGAAQREDGLFSKASWKPSDLKAKSLDSSLHESEEDGLSAAEQAIRAIEAQRSGMSAPTPAKGPSFGGLTSSLGSLKLSESFGAMPADAFLERLSRAEGMPSSPLLVKSGGAHKSLSRAMPMSVMPMVLS